MLCFNYGITMNLSQTGCNDEVLVAKKKLLIIIIIIIIIVILVLFLFFFKQCGPCAITWLQISLTDGASCCPA